jgi:hypothetical protein
LRYRQTPLAIKFNLEWQVANRRLIVCCRVLSDNDLKDATGTTLPARYYIDPDLYREELERSFGNDFRPALSMDGKF